MGDMREAFDMLRDERRRRRVELGVSCPGCPKVQPKRIPTLLMPGQRCKVCGHRAGQNGSEQTGLMESGRG